MGRAQAEEVANQVDIDTALRWHLRSNHYPPVPGAMIAPCKAAIEVARNWIEGEGEDELVDLPDGVQWKGRTDGKAPATAVIESFHLAEFIEAAMEDD